MKRIIKYGVILGIICVIAAGLLAGMNAVTRDRILAQAQDDELNSLKDVMPQAESFEPVKEKNSVVYYKGKDAQDNVIGFLFKTGKKGYSSVIETMAGVTPDGVITGIKILSQNETPGLGARIIEVKDDKTICDIFKKTPSCAPQKPWFQEQFSDKRIDSLEDVQTITGATISSRAVIESVKKRAEEILAVAGK